MKDHIELCADTALVILMACAFLVLMRADPLLPVLWLGASLGMTWMHR